MWNEDEFFKDYVESAKKIRPEPEYLQQLKSNVNTENLKKLKQKNQKKTISYLAAAASIVLCVSIGGFALWKTNSGTISPSLSAQRQESEISGNVTNDNPELSSVLSMLSDSATMLDDEHGESVSEAERSHLISLLQSCVKSDTEKNISLEPTVYYCVGEEAVKITVYEEQYIVVHDVVYEIK